MTPSFTNCHSRACAEVRRSIRRGISAFLIKPLLVVFFVILPHTVLAHSQPLKLEPAPGATLTQSPPEIRLTFSEPVRPNATITLFPQDSFAPILGLTAQQDPGNPAQIFVPLPSLSTGTYTVQWEIQSSDGHSLTGTYAFTIRPAAWVTRLPWLAIPIILFSATLIIRRRRM